ncbi:unnamed protein product, partial [Heligmosomoides polygyrus]|uniref:ULP_PROTEASE domain-containing protein n=1 Tax=Heligmosomoides polygyrus TaxID=6339 RepID=A0A183GSR3_HELPZ
MNKKSDIRPGLLQDKLVHFKTPQRPLFLPSGRRKVSRHPGDVSKILELIKVQFNIAQPLYTRSRVHVYEFVFVHVHVSMCLCVVSESRVPPSVRSAVSPRRSGKSPRQWPPHHALPTVRYWQIDPASQYRKEKENEPTSLHELVAASDIEDSSCLKRRRPRHQAAPAPQKTDLKSVGVSAAQTAAPLKSESSENRRESEISLSTKPSIHSGIHWTVIHAPTSPELRVQYPREEDNAFIHAPTSPELRIQYPREEDNACYRALNVAEPQEAALPVRKSDAEKSAVEFVPKRKSISLLPPATVDCSTSPIPSISLPRRRSSTAEPTEIIRALSPVPFRIRPPPSTPPQATEETSDFLEVATSSPFGGCATLVGVNTTPRPYSAQNELHSPVPTVEEKPRRTKPLKKVDFSVATVMPNSWGSSADGVDEGNVLEEFSPTSPSPSCPANASTPYDGDVSETYDNKSDVASTVDMDLAEEREHWMREELELARKEEL